MAQAQVTTEATCLFGERRPRAARPEAWELVASDTWKRKRQGAWARGRLPRGETEERALWLFSCSLRGTGGQITWRGSAERERWPCGR